MNKNVIFFHNFAPTIDNLYGCHNVTAIQLTN